MMSRISEAVLFFVNAISATRLAFESLVISALVGTALSLFSKKTTVL